MGTRRPPRTLPGTDALLHYKILIGISLGGAVIILGLTVATAIGAHGGHLGHFPWPIAQWALTTPLDTLVVALGGALVASLPLLVVRRDRVVIDSPVDVTALPPIFWPHPLPPTLRPGDQTPGEYWQCRGRRQRILSLLALALAVLLLFGFFAAYFAIAWYGIAHSPDCIGAHCPPSDGLLLYPWMAISTAIVILGQCRWVRQVERRCGIWFRVRAGAHTGLTCYVRRPGVTADAAAAALARYTQDVQGPAVRRGCAHYVLFSVPYFLVLLALTLLLAWLSTQWIPA